MKAVRIPVKSKVHYPGQFESWTETKTGEMVLKQDMFCLHKSYRPIKAFCEGVTTCVYGPTVAAKIIKDGVNINDLVKYDIIKTYDDVEEYCYLMRIPAGTFVERYEHEYRFEMHSGVIINYIGKKIGSKLVKGEGVNVYGNVNTYDINVYEASVFDLTKKK